MRTLLGGTLALVGYTAIWWGFTRIQGGNTDVMVLIVPARKSEYFLRPKQAGP